MSFEYPTGALDSPDAVSPRRLYGRVVVTAGLTRVAGFAVGPCAQLRRWKGARAYTAIDFPPRGERDPMPDVFADRHRRPTDPAITVFDITPDDGADLAQVTTALNVATPGRVRVTTVDGSVSDISVHPGECFPIRVRRVWQTGTTATGLRGLV